MRNEIRALRAEATAMTAEGQKAADAADAAIAAGKDRYAMFESITACVLARMSGAKLEAAASLEAEDRAREDKLTGAIGEG